MFSIFLEELPDGDDFVIIEHKAKQLITDKIQTEIVLWYQKHRINERLYKLFDIFRTECKFIKDSYKEIDKIIKGVKPPTAERLYPSQETENSSDFDECEIYPKFLVKLKRRFVLFSWTATPISARIILALGTVIGDYLIEMKRIRRYRGNKISHMLMLAERELEKSSSEAIYEDLRKTFLEDFRSDLEQVCNSIIPKQIKADQELIENIVKEDRDYQALKEEYIPIEQSCKQIIGHLLHAKLTLLSNQPCIKKEGIQLGRGSCSTVHLCDVQLGDRDIQCAVKKITSPLRHEEYEQLAEAVNLR